MLPVPLFRRVTSLTFSTTTPAHWLQPKLRKAMDLPDTTTPLGHQYKGLPEDLAPAVRKMWKGKLEQGKAEAYILARAYEAKNRREISLEEAVKESIEEKNDVITVKAT